MIPAWIIAAYFVGVPVATWGAGDALVQGAIGDGRAFNAGTLQRTAGHIYPMGGGVLYFLEQSLNPGNGPVEIFKTCGVIGYPYHRTPLRWRIGGGRHHFVSFPGLFFEHNVLYSSEYRSAPTDVVRQVGGAGVRDDAHSAAYVATRDVYCGLPSNFSDAVGNLPGDELTSITKDKAERARLWPFPHMDFLCGVNGGYEEYVLTRGKLTRWNTVLPPAANVDPCGWKKGPSWPVDWSGPFRMARAGDDRYAVTADGRAYRLPPASEPAAAPKLVWDGKPIRALIEDMDSGKHYAFTADQFFELGRDVKSHSHRVGAIPAATAVKAEEALGMVVRCGRAIRNLRVSAVPAAGSDSRAVATGQ